MISLLKVLLPVWIISNLVFILIIIHHLQKHVIPTNLMHQIGYELYLRVVVLIIGNDVEEGLVVHFINHDHLRQGLFIHSLIIFECIIVVQLLFSTWLQEVICKSVCPVLSNLCKLSFSSMLSLIHVMVL